jgi:hypothetical protein
MATANPKIGSPIAGLLKLTQGQCVEAHQRQYRTTQRHEYDVEHDRLLAGEALALARVNVRLRIGGQGVRIP